MTSQDALLLQLGRWLAQQQYRFTTVTPATHQRVNARPRNQRGKSLTDIFGWSRPFAPSALPKQVFEWLSSSEQLERDGELCRSRVRFSTLDDALYVHSAFPTEHEDDVFFGPDTYRFSRLLRTLSGRFARAIEVGAGTGAGLLTIRRLCASLYLTDINPRALRFAAVNAALQDATVNLVQSNVLSGVTGAFDLICSNPPYLVDPKKRSYRHGGERGIELPVRIVEESLQLLSRRGTLLLYTGAPVVSGQDLFRERLTPILRGFNGSVVYEELDPDVFGEELEAEAYGDVERISLVSLRVTRAAP